MNTEKFYAEQIANEYAPKETSKVKALKRLDNKVKLLIDEDILKQEYFGFHPMLNTSTLKVNVRDFVSKIIPALKHEPTIVKIP